eukprot:TRINITY_DN2297_c0_g1_i2.p1 TRINITY_DN2297_c0_g1~~TRINITY_DN2297_c0_g1_i2.p1  ORF type:complete len:343 (-),score=69.94 TRINITY_DN2297_c0_g1_i2:617-1645(-)
MSGIMAGTPVSIRSITCFSSSVKHTHGQGRGKEQCPPFMPPQLNNVKDLAARLFAARVQRLPVQTKLANEPIMSSCIMPKSPYVDSKPLVFLHGFDSSCLEWRYTYPLLEAAGVEAWAIDLLGWGFTERRGVSSFSVVAKRDHLYKFWETYIRRPMTLVGASLGGAAAIDFAAFYPEAVSTLMLIGASVYSEGNKRLDNFPKLVAYAGILLLKSIPLRLYANNIAFQNMSFPRKFDSMKVGRLHCLLPYWEEATLDFMSCGGYTVASLLKEINKKTLLIWGENDKIVTKDSAERLKNDIKGSSLIYLSDCGHLPHVEKPEQVAELILEFLKCEQLQRSDNGR